MNKRLQKLSNLRNRYYMLLDGLVLASMPAIALLIRLESVDAVWEKVAVLLVFTVFMGCVKLFVFLRAGLYNHYWAYASSEELVTLVKVGVLAFLAEQVLSYGLLLPLGVLPAGFPRSLPLLDGILSAVAVSGIRAGVRLLFGVARRREFNGEVHPVLIAGAGVAGTMVARELLANPHMGLVPVGYLDDNRTKIGKTINGVRVLGPLESIPRIARARSVSTVVIAMPAAPGQVVREVVRLCKEAGVESKTVPALFEIVNGTAQIQQIRSIQLEDLLRRGVIHTDTSQVGHLLGSARVLVTGAGGSIGGELCRQVMKFRPAEIVLLGHGENSIFQIQRELKARRIPGVAIHPVIADIREKDRLRQVMKRFQPEVIFHAAAHKHVWLMEQNAADAVTNNILGTRNLVELSEELGVDRFVMISSDKAVNPSSIMGVTKRIAELVVHDAARESRCAFITVRFGNVLGSRGSVVPIFENQIRSGGPVTVTHPEVKRFFMTIPEAVQLVLQAGSMGKGGEIFVLDMGEQIKVADIARDLIRLHGLEEEKDIRIQFTGLTKGEKLYEELFYRDENVIQTTHEKVLAASNGFRAATGPSAEDPAAAGRQDAMRADVDALIAAAFAGDEDRTTRLFSRLVPQFGLPETAAAHRSPTDSALTGDRASLPAGEWVQPSSAVPRAVGVTT